MLCIYLNKTIYMHFIEPADRNQIIFMNKLDDLVGSDNSIRILDCMIDFIIKENPLAFIDKGQFSIGRKAYFPGLFIKLYIYGYFNGTAVRANAGRAVKIEGLDGKLQNQHIKGKLISEERQL